MPDIVIKNNIRKLRFQNDEMTQEQLAGIVGCTRQTIISLEAGRYVPSLALAFKISMAFGVSVADVFEFEAK
jgi:putative transcriptional regulator